MPFKTLISAQNLSIGYGKTRNRDASVLYENLTFELNQGELVCLLGANGAGKSTLLRTMIGAQPALGGKIYFEGKDITSYQEKDLSQLIGVVLTDKAQVGGLTVKELVELGRYPYTGFFGKLTHNDKEIAAKAMNDVSIFHKAENYMAELSDGERQKVMIAKALTQECPILLLDEPTAFLDIQGRIEIMTLLHDLAVNEKKTILLSSHDMDLAFRLADKLWLLTQKNGLETGTTEDLILRGAIDNFFESAKIAFQKETGNFTPLFLSKQNVYVKASTLTLQYWGENFILKNGCGVSKDAKLADLILIVNSEDHLQLRSNNIELSFSSFTELKNYIQA